MEQEGFGIEPNENNCKNPGGRIHEVVAYLPAVGGGGLLLLCGVRQARLKGFSYIEFFKFFLKCDVCLNITISCVYVYEE